MVEMWDQYDEYAVAHYSDFRIERNTTIDANHANHAPDYEDYQLFVGGFWVENGVHDAGDALSGFNGTRFSHRNRQRSGSRSAWCFRSTSSQYSHLRSNPGW